MARTETIELTNMCLLRNGEQVLVENRRKKEWPGITFPGGHVELGESFHQAMIREFFEETGLTLLDPKLWLMTLYPRSTKFKITLIYIDSYPFDAVR